VSPQKEPRHTTVIVDGADSSELHGRNTPKSTSRQSGGSGPWDDIFAEARERFTIDHVWLMCGITGEPKRSCRSPFREERTPSFTIYEDGRKWKDHGGDCGGDVIEFVKVATGKDYPEVREWFREALGKPLPLPQTVTKASGRPPGIKLPADLIKGTTPTWEAFARNRGILSHTVFVMVESSLLRFSSIDGVKCFVVMDATKRAAEIRRIDRKTFGKSKAYPLPGVDKTWLPGAELLRTAKPGTSVLLAEGATDFLTAVNLYVRFRREVTRNQSWVVVTLLGAGCKSLDPECAKLIAGRHVRIVPDADDAGDKMLAHWKPMLLGLGCPIDTVLLPRGTDLTDNAAEIEPQTLFNL